MGFLGWRLLIISIAVFFADLLTLGNSNFIIDPILQTIGQVIGAVAALSILINFVFVVVNMIGKIRRHSLEEWERKDPSEKRAIRIKRLVGFLIWIWLFVIFPLIAMYWMGILSKIFAEPGLLVGKILFTVLVIIGTTLPSIFLSPLKTYLIPLFLLSFFFVFSKNQHKWLDPVLYILLIVLSTLQIWKFSSITNPEAQSEQTRTSIDGENKLVVVIVDINNNPVDGVEACVSLPEDRLMRHKCQISGNGGKVTFMLKAGYYLFGFGSQNKDLPGTTTPEFDIKDGQTIETELVIGK